MQAAHEKELLQRKGDQLDADIRKAEKETRALENTVRLLTSRNQTFHRSLARVADTSQYMMIVIVMMMMMMNGIVFSGVAQRPFHHLSVSR